MRAPTRTILILGGTREATELAGHLASSPGLRVISSLAGRTLKPVSPAGEIRIGGFGGVAGLAHYIAAENIDMMIDATHPFALVISENARKAANKTGIALKLLMRPPWRAQDGDRWHPASSPEEAASLIPSDANVLLALGRQHLGAFSGRSDVTFAVRMVDPPVEPLLLADYTIVLGRPSVDTDAEAALLSRHAITHIVCRNSGGDGAYAKLAAARDLAIPVIMIERPLHAPDADSETFKTSEALAASIVQDG